MRAILLAFALGGLTMMTVEAEAQEKKEPPPLKKPYTMYVTVKTWTGKMFLDPYENRPAYWYTREDGKKQDKDGNDLLAVHAAHAASMIKTEITDKDGNVWVVTGKPDKISPGETVFPVKKKPKD